MKRMFGTLLILVLTATLAPAQMPEHHATMDEEHCAMMQKPGVDDAKLQAMLEDMNKSSGQAKIDKMAAVINELVAQRGGCSMTKKASTSAAMDCH